MRSIICTDAYRLGETIHCVYSVYSRMHRLDAHMHGLDTRMHRLDARMHSINVCHCVCTVDYMHACVD